MKRSAIALSVFSFFCMALFVQPGKASAIPLVDAGVPTGAILLSNIIFADQFVASQFTLPIGATITEISPFVGKEAGMGPDPSLLVQLTDAIGPGTPASAVLFESSLTVSNPITSQAFLPISTSFFLDEGTYFLVFSSDSTSADSRAALGFGAPIDVGLDFLARGAFGEVNLSFPPASQFITVPNRNYAFKISGNTIPEPSTFLLLGSGLAGLAAWRWRKLKVSETN